MLTQLCNDELLAVHGGINTLAMGAIFTGAGATLSALTAIFHAAGDPDDAKGTTTIFTEHTANVITFVLSCLATITTGIGTTLITIGNANYQKTK